MTLPVEVTHDEGGRGDEEEGEPCVLSLEYDRWMYRLRKIEAKIR